MAVGPYHFLITELQLLKVPFLLSVSLRAETGNFTLPLPQPPLLPTSCSWQQQKSMELTPEGEGGRADCDPKEGWGQRGSSELIDEMNLGAGDPLDIERLQPPGMGQRWGGEARGPLKYVVCEGGLDYLWSLGWRGGGGRGYWLEWKCDSHAKLPIGFMHSLQRCLEEGTWQPPLEEEKWKILSLVLLGESPGPRGWRCPCWIHYWGSSVFIRKTNSADISPLWCRKFWFGLLWDGISPCGCLYPKADIIIFLCRML